MRMTKRTEERLEIAKAKENLWRKHRGQGEMKTGEEDAWETLREKIMELEEVGAWREIGKEASLMMKARLQNPKVGDVHIHGDGVELVEDVLEVGDELEDDEEIQSMFAGPNPVVFRALNSMMASIVVCALCALWPCGGCWLPSRKHHESQDS